MEDYIEKSDEIHTETLLLFKRIMKKKRITQKKLAILLNISETTLIRYFKKETIMPLDAYFKIRQILKIESIYV